MPRKATVIQVAVVLVIFVLAEQALSQSSSTSYMPLVQRPYPAPTPTPRPSPLFVGFSAQWDGLGFIDFDNSYEAGIHRQRYADGMTDQDTLRVIGREWYDPNPFDIDSDEWASFYSITTGDLRSTSRIVNPNWKWSWPWFLPLAWQLWDGIAIDMNGATFLVSGPINGYTTFGQRVQYWELTNPNTVLVWADDHGHDQRAHPGDIVLRYDAGASRLWLYSDIMRRGYEDNELTNDTVHYIQQLTQTNAIPLPEGQMPADIDLSRNRYNTRPGGTTSPYASVP